MNTPNTDKATASAKRYACLDCCLVIEPVRKYGRLACPDCGSKRLQLLESVNEHDALLAVAEAAKALVNKPASTTNQWEMLDTALAALEAVRKGAK